MPGLHWAGGDPLHLPRRGRQPGVGVQPRHQDPQAPRHQQVSRPRREERQTSDGAVQSGLPQDEVEIPNNEQENLK